LVVAHDIRQVAADETYPLRQRVLRPHQTVAQVGSPADGDADAGHFAAYQGGKVVGVVSVLHQSPDDGPEQAGWWRLRGMATAEEVRGRGIGRALVAAVVAHAVAHDGTVLWCHARLPAVGFYRAAGFEATGEVWEEPAIGPHIAMWRSLR
jgi:ribosomal protein S18 acetylase RimI-like enzyme